MSHAVKINARFATAEDTAEALGVTHLRVKQLVTLVKSKNPKVSFRARMDRSKNGVLRSGSKVSRASRKRRARGKVSKSPR